jgi:DNA topoisomerase VI subunit B
MEGKELWALLDVVKELRERGDMLEKQVGEKERTVEEQDKIKSYAKIYRDVADKLENLLQKLVSYNKASFF